MPQNTLQISPGMLFQSLVLQKKRKKKFEFSSILPEFEQELKNEGLAILSILKTITDFVS